VPFLLVLLFYKAVKKAKISVSVIPGLIRDPVISKTSGCRIEPDGDGCLKTVIQSPALLF